MYLTWIPFSTKTSMLVSVPAVAIIQLVCRFLNIYQGIPVSFIYAIFSLHFIIAAKIRFVIYIDG